MEEMVINKVPGRPQESLSVAHSEYKGRGLQNVAKSWASHVTVHSPESGALFTYVIGLHYTSSTLIGVLLLTTSWEPDISLMTSNTLTHPLESLEDLGGTLIDLIAHKLPTLKVLENNVDADSASISTLWFQRGQRSG